MYVGGGLTFVYDEWGFIYERREWTLEAFLTQVQPARMPPPR